MKKLSVVANDNYELGRFTDIKSKIKRELVKETKLEKRFNTLTKKLNELPHKHIEQKLHLKLCLLFIKARIGYGKDQNGMASKLGVTQGTISKIEAGSMLPSAILYLRLKHEFPQTEDIKYND